MTESRTEKVSRANEFINDHIDNNGFCLTWHNLTGSGYIFFKSQDLAEEHTYYSEFENLPEHQPDDIAKLTGHPKRNEIICEVSIWDCTLINEKGYNKVMNYVNDDNEAAATELLTEIQLEFGKRIAYKESFLTDDKDELLKLRFNYWRKAEEIPDEESTQGLTYIICNCKDAVKRNSDLEKLLLMNPTNFQLTDIIESCTDAELRNRAGEKLLTVNPTNRGLAYIICHCTDLNLRNEAWERLQTQHPKGMDMTCILSFCDNEDLRNRGLKWVQKYDVSNSSLVETMEMCSDKNVRNSIGEILRENLRIKEIDEPGLIRKIAERVLNHPSDSEKQSWHCLTEHSLADWATILDPTAKKIAHEYGTPIAAAAVLPNYSHLFYSDNETVLHVLKSVYDNKS